MNTFQRIIKRLQHQGWRKDWMDESTYCLVRPLSDDRLMLSAYFITDKKEYIKIIAIDDEIQPTNITLGYAENSKGNEIYRIDYEIDKPKKGWHIDSEKFGLCHYTIDEIKDVDDAVDFLVYNRGSIFSNICLTIDSESMTNVENIANEAVFKKIINNFVLKNTKYRCNKSKVKQKEK